MSLLKCRSINFASYPLNTLTKRACLMNAGCDSVTADKNTRGLSPRWTPAQAMEVLRLTANLGASEDFAAWQSPGGMMLTLI